MIFKLMFKIIKIKPKLKLLAKYKNKSSVLYP